MARLPAGTPRPKVAFGAFSAPKVAFGAFSAPKAAFGASNAPKANGHWMTYRPTGRAQTRRGRGVAHPSVLNDSFRTSEDLNE
jgi:hypothetical protein